MHALVAAISIAALSDRSRRRDEGCINGEAMLQLEDAMRMRMRAAASSAFCSLQRRRLQGARKRDEGRRRQPLGVQSSARRSIRRGATITLKL
jgi:hypothetical protein